MLGRRIFARFSSPVGRRAGWTFTDQALSSVTNFALAVFVARAVEPREFGVFGLAFAAYLLLLNFSRALGAQPLLLRFSAAAPEAQRAAVPGSSGLALLLGLVSGVIIAFVAVIARDERSALLALAITLPGLLLQDTWRFIFFALARPAAAAANDGVWAIAQLFVFAGLYVVGVRTAAPFVLGWGFSASVAAVAGIAQARAVPSLTAGYRWLKAHRDIGPMLSIEFFATGATGQLTLFAVVAFAGLAGVASLRAAQVALGPLGVVFTGLLIVGQPELSRIQVRDPGRMARAAMLIGFLGFALAVLVGLAVFFLPDAAGEALLRDNWIPAHRVIIPTALALAFSGLMTGPFLQMRVVEAVKQTLSLRIAMLVAAVSAATVAAKLWGVQGAAWSGAIVTAIFAWLSWLQARKVLARHSHVPAGPAPLAS